MLQNYDKTLDKIHAKTQKAAVIIRLTYAKKVIKLSKGANRRRPNAGVSMEPDEGGQSGPKCPKCCIVNNVWQFRKPDDGEWYLYTCGGCGVQYQWMVQTIRKFEVRL
jgi:hypothetical protein